MKKFQNENTTDRIIRAILGIIFMLIAFVAVSGAIKIVLIVLAVILLFTSATGFCTLYKLFGIDTRSK